MKIQFRNDNNFSDPSDIIRANIRGLTNREKISIAVMWGCLWLLFSMQSILTDVKMSFLYCVLLGIVCGMLSIFMFIFLSRRWDKLIITAENKSGHFKILGLEAAICTLAVFAIYFAGQYPGGFSYDSHVQYSQALGETGYNDWHPVLHTLLFFTLPIKAGGSLALIVFLQLLYFSFAFGYLIYVLSKNGCSEKFINIICCFVWINPCIATYMMIPWKDEALTVFAVLVSGYYIQIIESKGKWFEKTLNVIIFSAAIVCCTFMRHNAILFTAPLLTICICRSLISRKIKFKIIACIVFIFCMVKVLYVCLDVEKPGSRIVETIGMPATIWCNVMKKNPDALPKETSELLYKFATPYDYENVYHTGHFNSIKRPKRIDLDKMNKLTYSDVTKITLQCIINAPKESLEAFVKLTGMVWAVDGKKYTTIAQIEDNKWGIVYKPNKYAASIVKMLNRLSTYMIVNIIFCDIGSVIVTLIIISAAAFSNGRNSFVHILPLLCYDFGTMLFLSGNDYRYFLLNIPLWLPTIFMILHDASYTTQEPQKPTVQEPI